MKRLPTLALVVLLSGCALFRADSPEEAKLRDLQNTVYAAASIGTSIALVDHPAWKPRFEAAYRQLDTLVRSQTVTGELLRQIVASLPVKELKSEKARIAIEGATMLFDMSVGTSVSLEQTPYVLAAATGLRDGLRAGLGL
jgi:hypothetical protein